MLFRSLANSSMAQLKEEKSKLFESLKAIKSEMNSLQNDKIRLEALVSDEKSKTEKAQNEAFAANTLAVECQRLRSRIAQLEAEAKAPSMPISPIPLALPLETQSPDLVWEQLKEKIQDLANDFSSLSDDVLESDNLSKQQKAYTVKEILDKIKRIGDKI